MKDDIFSDIGIFFSQLFPNFNLSSFLRISFFILAMIVSAAAFFLILFILANRIEKYRSSLYLKNHQIFDDIAKLEAGEEEKKVLSEVAVKSVILGARIDFHTDRRINSRFVSSLVYRVAEELKLGLKEKIIYTCAAMVYDAGFLDQAEELFHAEILSGEEKRQLQRHVMGADTYLNYVPLEFYRVFIDASMFHHENFDGSGYPEGLSKNEIPEIARIIRVAESLSSLMKRRNYKKGMDFKNSVIEMHRHSNFYDVDLLRIITRIEKQNQLEKSKKKIIHGHP